MKRGTIVIVLLVGVVAILQFFLYYGFFFPPRNKVIANKHKHYQLKGLHHRAFEKWNHSFPCFEGHINKGKTGVGNNLKGMIYIKCQKTASTTVSSITMRIRNLHGGERKCAAWWDHAPAWEKDVSSRNKTSTYLFSFIRHPAKRMTSQFFYHQVSKRGVNATLENLMMDINERNLNNYQIRYLYPAIAENPNDDVLDSNNASTKLERIISEYNFIGLTERFDESLVALRLLLGLNAEDILYISTNNQGSYAVYRNECIPIKKTVLTPYMKNYLSSDEFYMNNIGDFMLYEAVNKSLDETIQNKIGKSKFDRALKEHKNLMSLVHSNCVDRVRHLCPGEGSINKKNNCYRRSFGCGYDCLDVMHANVSNSLDVV